MVAQEEDASGPWEPERSGKGSPGSGPEGDGSSGRGAQEPVSSTVCGEQQEEEEEEEEEEGSCYSEEGEDGSNIYFYYTIGERWIDYLQRTEDGGLLRHVRPKVTWLGARPQARALPQRAGLPMWLVAPRQELMLARCLWSRSGSWWPQSLQAPTACHGGGARVGHGLP